MKAANILAMLGAFCAGFGALILTQDVPKWFWWLGQGMVVAGPIFLGSRAIAGMRQGSDSPEAKITSLEALVADLQAKLMDGKRQ